MTRPPPASPLARLALLLALACAAACAPAPDPQRAAGPASAVGCASVACDEVLADLGLPPSASTLETTLASPFFRPAGPSKTRILDASDPMAWARAGVDALVVPTPGELPYTALTQAAPVHTLRVPRMNSPIEGGYPAYVANLRKLGALTGRDRAAEAAVGRFDAALAALRARATPRTRDLRVLVLIDTLGYWALPTEGAFCAALRQAELGRCLGDTRRVQEYAPEHILALDPDYVVYLTGAPKITRDDPVWRRLRAVREGRLYASVGARHYWCCSLRALLPALQEYAHHVVDPTVPLPGPLHAFDPARSPLVTASP